MKRIAEEFEPGPPQPVSKGRTDQRWTLTFTQIFPQPAAAVWSALTDPEELLAWAPYGADRNLGSVGPATLVMTEGSETTRFDGHVTVATSPVLLEHAWGRHHLRWELRAVPSGTELTLRHTLAPDDNDDELAMMAAGWHLCLLVAERLLDGTPIPPIFGAKALDFGFGPLRDVYSEILDRPPH